MNWTGACLVVLLAVLGGSVCLAEEHTESLHPALRMMPVPAGQGVNIHFYKGNEQDLSMLTEAGVGIIRMDVGWARCEKEPGVFDFSQYDQLVADLEQRGIRLLFIIDYGNPLYDNGLAPHSEECRQAYARFCAALAGRYADKRVIWELWNEPNIGFWKPKPNVDDYMAWCRAVVPAIREADPAACVIAPATSGIPLGFLEDCFERGLLTLVDGVSVHPYRPASQGPETALPAYEKLAALIARYKPSDRGIPILSGEWGYSTTLLSPELQGKYLPRQWLANMAAGLPISIWYDWHDDGRDPEEKEHNFGTVTWDYKPKPAYTAMRTLVDQLRGYMPVGRLDTESGDDYIVAFRRDGAHKVAVWTTGEPHDFAAPAGVTISAGVDHLGGSTGAGAGHWERIDDGPRYLEIDAPVPTWLQMMPLELEARHGVAAGKEGGVVIPVTLKNPTEAPVAVSFAAIESKRVDGQWESGTGITLAPNEVRQTTWRGTLTRRDCEQVSLQFAVDIRAKDEAIHRVTRTVTLPVSNPLSLRLVWRHDGLRVLVKSDDPVRGQLIATVNGETRGSVAVQMDEGGTEQSVSFTDVRFSGQPLGVEIRLDDEKGHLLAATEPMTYQLVDAVDLAEGADTGGRYRLWHEGEEQRQATLNSAVAPAPGDDPPFPQALRVDYDVAPGWCFWQAGPTNETALPHPQPKRVMLWVHGDAAGDRMRCRVVDATGQTFQTDAGLMDFTGWRYVEQALDGPMGNWGGAEDGSIHPPLRWISYYLQDPLRSARAGTTYLTGVVVAW
jgi:polysaccharide biosynthesis protein PslG